MTAPTAKKPEGRPVAPDGADLYYCEDCDKLWRIEDLKPMHHSWSRHEDGDEFHPFECKECGCTTPLAEGSEVRFSPTPENLKKHAYHSGVVIVLCEKKESPELTCKQCSDEKTYKVKESEISKPEEDE